MHTSREIDPWLGGLCGVFVGVNALVALVLFLKKRPRVAFQALILPFICWPTFLFSYALVSSNFGPFTAGTLLLVFTSEMLIAASISVIVVRLIAWPPIPIEDLTAADVEADRRNTRVLSFALLLGSLAVTGLGGFVVVWSVSFLPQIMAPGSGGFAQMLMAFFMGGAFLFGGGILFWGIAGIVMSCKRLAA